MTAYIIIALIFIVIVSIITLEYKNEKKYQEERQKRKEARKKVKPSTPKPAKQKPKKQDIKTKEPVEKKTPQVVKEPVKKKIKLPKANFPRFDHSRLLEMGLSDEEAKEYVKELIPQIETQIPLLEEALKEMDFHAMERLTHSLKGSSTTVGTGGVSDLLVEYNTYLKDGREPEVADAYLTHLKNYNKALEQQYS